MASKGSQVISEQLLTAIGRLVRLGHLEALNGAIDANLFNRPLHVCFYEVFCGLLAPLEIGVDLLAVLLQVGDPEILQVVSLLDLLTDCLFLLMRFRFAAALGGGWLIATCQFLL